MISTFTSSLDKIGDFILDATIPHERNDHRPHTLRSHGLFLLLALILISQISFNFIGKSGDLLGYATNITTQAVVSFTNQERNAVGLPTLAQNSSLASAAVLKAKDMFAKDYWAHFAPDGTSPWYFFGLVGYQYASAGENLARDFATSSGVVNAWMASPGHKANILNPSFTEIGVGVVNGNLQGEDTTLVVQLFGKPLNQAAASAASTSGNNSSGTPSSLTASVEVPETSEANQVPIEPDATEQLEPVVTSPDNSLVAEAATLVANTTQSQRVTIALLFLVGCLFVLDSFIIFRKRHLRVGSHSFAHASVILILVITSLVYGWGTTL